eukprot:gene15939-biopygen13560
MSNRSYPSGAAKKKLKKIRETESLKNVPKLTSLGFNSKPKETEGNYGEGIQEDICELSTEGQNQTLSTNEKIAYVTDKEEDLSGSESDSSCEESRERSRKGDVEESLLVSHFSNDAAQWTEITEELRHYWASNGPTQCQRWTSPYIQSAREFKERARIKTRYFSESLLHRKLPHGEKIKREWLLYSLSTGKVFCFYCKLFESTNHSSMFSNEGFDDWKHPEMIHVHERSSAHFESIQSCRRWKTRQSLIDTQHQQQIQKEEAYWGSVLSRVVEVVKFLGERGLALRGDSHIIGNSDNGNFLGIMELIGKFDPFLADHIARFGNQGSGYPSYLSHATMEEIVSILGNALRESIVASIKEAKYYSIIVDSTPDVSHVDQLTLVVRYIENGKPVERFVGFTPIKSHKSESLTSDILETLKALTLDIDLCRGQSYDNASNMSGKYTGVQARIKEVNSCAPYMPCASYSLNLVGNVAAECCREAVSFFSIVSEVYNFFSSSTYRWDSMKENLAKHQLVVKKLSDTRWSARHDAIRALAKGSVPIKKSLDELADDEEQTMQTRHDAESISDKMNALEYASMCLFWYDLLGRINATNLSLQTIDLSLSCVVDLYRSLKSYISEIRSEGKFKEYLDKAKSFSDATYQEFRDERRRKIKRKKATDKSATSGVELAGERAFYVNTYLPIIDSLQTELSRRQAAYELINDRFGFLVSLDSKDVDVATNCKVLKEAYPNHFDDDMEMEIRQYRKFIEKPLQTFLYKRRNLLDTDTECHKKRKKLKRRQPHERQKPISEFLLEQIVKGGVAATFPNAMTALRLLLTLPCGVASGERSFSMLKRVKSQLRSTMSQDRVTALCLMAANFDVLRGLDAKKIICNFAAVKARRKELAAS